MGVPINREICLAGRGTIDEKAWARKSQSRLEVDAVLG
jgi:hypothetical protein